MSVDDEGALGAELYERARQDGDELRRGNADHLPAHAGGIGERSEEIEERAYAELLSHRSHVPHRRVMSGSEEEPDPAFVDAGGDLGGQKLHLGAERRQHVGAAAFRRGGAIAVLGDPGAGCRGHERRGGGDVEGVRAVASGAASVDEPIEPHFHPHGARPHRLCRARSRVDEDIVLFREEVGAFVEIGGRSGGAGACAHARSAVAGESDGCERPILLGADFHASVGRGAATGRLQLGGAAEHHLHWSSASLLRKLCRGNTPGIETELAAEAAAYVVLVHVDV